MDDAADIVAPVPKELGKGLRCCGVCHLLKSFDQFYDSGCENCPFLQMDGDQERIFDSTTAEFQGMISVVDPSTSWSAKWLHLRKKVPGCYALSVEVDFPQNVLDILENQGIQIRQD